MAERPTYPGTPRWAKIFGITAIVVILLFVVLLFTRGHGPARSASGNESPSTGVMEDQAPFDH